MFKVEAKQLQIISLGRGLNLLQIDRGIRLITIWTQDDKAIIAVSISRKMHIMIKFYCF